MKRAVILHGTDGSPTELSWQRWMENELKASGYEVYFPQLPECHTPDLELYDQFLQRSGWDFSDNLIIGHSSGATTLLHLLQQNWFPKINTAVLVGTFLNERLLDDVVWYEPGQFNQLFGETFDPKVIKQNAERFYFVHGDDDPYCDYNEAKELCASLGGTLLTISGGGHIAKSSGIIELPILMSELHQDMRL